MQVYSDLCITLCIMCKTQVVQGVFTIAFPEMSLVYYEYMQE